MWEWPSSNIAPTTSSVTGCWRRRDEGSRLRPGDPELTTCEKPAPTDEYPTHPRISPASSSGYIASLDGRACGRRVRVW